MVIGIVSDTHGKAGRLRQALAVLVERGARAIVHCGDIGSTECLTALAEAGLPAYAVVGNMDRHLDRLAAEARRTGVVLSFDTILLPLSDGTYLAATHGQDAAALAQLIGAGRFRYVCHGHTHRVRDERVGACRVINPGALHFARPMTVAVLDTDADTVEHVEIR